MIVSASLTAESRKVLQRKYLIIILLILSVTDIKELVSSYNVC